MAHGSNRNTTYCLRLSYNDEDNCALTVLVNDVRFHIMVDAKDLQKSSEKPLYYEYLDKVSALREADEREGEMTTEAQAIISKGKTTKEKASNDKDSAIDMTICGEENEDEDEDQDSGSASIDLRNWILSAVTGITAECAPPGREFEDSTLYEWYHGPTYFYKVHIKSGKLTAELLETTTELNDLIEQIVPRMKVPKYIQNIDVPWHSSHNLIVQSEVSMPEPAHPGKVAHNETGETYFFKPVEATQPSPFKREVDILRKLEKLNLDIKVPTLRGFVAFQNSKTEVMGLLLSHIDNPQPLTKLLSSCVSKSKRETWSKKSEHYVKCLHDNHIIWGDAKADNFLVDEKDELWIIDFGGSYTDGWVDPELSETKEGDEQGLEKIQQALEDPDRNTQDTAAGAGDTVKETASSLFVTERKDEKGSGKRKRDNDGEEEEEEMEQESGRKRTKDEE